jgi:acyl-coenzyme A thioesterase PaaI-like protein
MATFLESAEKILHGEAAPPPIAWLLGFTLNAVEPGRTVFEMDVDQRHHNPMGTLDGDAGRVLGGLDKIPKGKKQAILP